MGSAVDAGGVAVSGSAAGAQTAQIILHITTHEYYMSNGILQSRYHPCCCNITTS